jgi:Glycosyl transferase family 11
MANINIELCGGMGNQLFQYALGRELQHRGHEVTFALGATVRKPQPATANVIGYLPNYELGAPGYHNRFNPEFALDGFNTKFTIGEPVGKVIREWTSEFHPEILDLKEDSTLYGYWQNENYFPSIGRNLRNDLSPRGEPSSGLKALAEEIYDNKSLGIHVRRGERVRYQDVLNFHGEISPNFYRQAFATYMNDSDVDISRSKNVYIFTDEPVWCQENLPNVRIVNTDSHYWDFFLLSLCQYFIIPNSTFSWWAAWLSGGRVISPYPWFLNTPAYLVPERWVKIPR